MNRDCNFRCKRIGDKYRCACTRLGCGNRIEDRDNIPKRISAKCRGVYELGDLIAWLLGRFGLTKQRYRDVKVFLHLAQPGTGCRECDRRQRWLNELLPRACRWTKARVRLGRKLNRAA